MNQHVTDILQDLYRLDPELKKDEERIVRIIDKLLAARPETGFDENFRRELRSKVLAELAERTAVKLPFWRAATRAFLGAPRPVFAFGGAIVGVLLVFTLLNTPRSATPIGPVGDIGLGEPSIKVGLVSQITALGKNAFGSLSGERIGGAPGVSSGSSEAVAMDLGLSPAPAEPGSAPTPTLAARGMGGGGGFTGVSPEAMLVPYRPQVGYRFNYAGQLNLTDTEVDVLMREKDLDSKLLAALVSRVDLGLMDLGRLRDLNIQNISLVEDKDFGYQVNVNFDDGSIFIGQNWQRWPQPYACRAGLECQPQRLQLGDMPADGELLRLADDFLREMGISTESYGPPRVDDGWRRYYESAEDKAEYWFPDQITVEYPLLVNGLKVYNGDGRTVGMMVGIDVRNRRVNSISPIYVQKFASSAYDAVTDTALAAGLINAGGMQPMYPEGAERMIDLDLDEPEKAYYSHWIYRDGRSENVLVPALVFAIKDGPQDGSVYLEKVVLPLAKEVLDQIGGGYPALLMKGGEEPVVIEPVPANTPPIEVRTESIP